MPAMPGRRSCAFSLDLIHDVWAGFVCEGSGAEELVVQAVTGAFGSVMAWWLDKAPDLTPAEVDRRFRASMRGVL